MSAIVYGPQGCGKSQAAATLAATFGCSQVLDEWKPGDPLPPDALALTNVPGVPGAVEYFEVAKSR